MNCMSLALGALFAVSVLPAGAAGYDRIVIEEAWVVPDNTADTASLYLVINNGSGSDVVLRSVSTPVAASSQLRRPSGEEFPSGALVPLHAELYMQPGGVHVALTALADPLTEGQLVPIQVVLDGGLSANFTAVVLAPGAATPDHHDYKH